ncbi:dithiobiotin synthetase [Haemophilus influenzae R3021]|uniref:Dithiobiotin synthetase n=1 Tax=Haemophilus influenzae R3021 TaxID=375432 RepID=A4N6L8_HAEIF|nr:dithiobiotin synthetase [Haemophilus influenzae R3021]
MKTKFYDHQGEHLIVYFAGWGTPLDEVAHLILPTDHDLLICYDYQDLNLDFDFSAYQQIRVVAWSMGVWAAERALQGIRLKSATAVNGTGLPCDDNFGIPCAVFKGTLENLTENTRLKFERRMCGDKAEDYQQFPTRPFDEIHQELTALFAMIGQDRRTDLIRWTNALIGSQDKIFMPANQHRYWTPRCTVQETDGGHYLFSRFSHWSALWNH